MFFTIYEQIISECRRIDEQICSIRKALKGLPAGKLICSYNQGYTKWYQTDGAHKSYIPKSNISLASELAGKKYLSLLLDDLETERKALSFYLRHHSDTQKSEVFLTEPSEYQRLLAPIFTPHSKEAVQWMNAPYEHNPHHPENLIHKTLGGSNVRSKSELLIDMCLRTHNIPFRYECALQLGDVTIYPDFTIMHPATHKLYYWEHFGMMENPTYLENVCSKIHLYASSEIIPGIDLITTYETKTTPLDISMIEHQIKYYFL